MEDEEMMKGIVITCAVVIVLFTIIVFVSEDIAEIAHRREKENTREGQANP